MPASSLCTLCSWQRTALKHVEAVGSSLPSLSGQGADVVAGSSSFEKIKNYLQGPSISWRISEVGRCAGRVGRRETVQQPNWGRREEQNRWEEEAKEGCEAVHIYQ